MTFVNFAPVRRHDISQNHVRSRMIVAYQYVAIIHRAGVHVRMKVEDVMKDCFGRKGSVLV